jgi:hypothetical protein
VLQDPLLLKKMIKITLGPGRKPDAAARPDRGDRAGRTNDQRLAGMVGGNGVPASTIRRWVAEVIACSPAGPRVHSVAVRVPQGAVDR